jgi:hypothetical protein
MTIVHKRGDATPPLRANNRTSQPANRDIRAITSGRFSANKARYFGLNQRSTPKSKMSHSLEN